MNQIMETTTEKTNWVRKLAKADLLSNRLRSVMTIISVVIIITLSSICVIVYLSLLNSTDKMIAGDVNFSIGFYIFLIIPVIFCGLLLIIDCFHLNRANSVRQNGLMSSIGLTQKQNRSMLRWQTLYLSGLGFLAGAVIVLVFVYLILPAFINNIYTDFQIVGLTTTLLVIIASGIVSMGLVNTGLYISYYESEQLSISARIRYMGNLPYRKNASRQKISASPVKAGYPGRRLNRYMMALRNYAGNLMNNGHVLASLIFALSTLLMVSVIVSGIHPNAFADSYIGKNDYKLYNRTFAYDYVEKGSAEELFSKGGGQYKSPSKEVFTEELVDDIRQNSKIKSLKIIKTLNMSYKSKFYTEDQYFEDSFAVVNTDYILSRFNEGHKPDDELIEKFEKGEVALMPETQTDCIDLGFRISGSVMNEGVYGQSYEKAFEKNKFNMAVYSVPDDPSEGNPEVYSGFYIHENFLDAIDIMPINSSIEFSADNKDRPSVQKWIDERVSNNDLIKSESRDRYAALAQTQKDAFFMVGYLLAIILVVISFIGFAITNTVSIDTRKHEFFVLKCVGMSRRDIKSMLLTEGLIYGIVVVIIMTAVINPLIFLLYNNFKMYYNTYHFPLVLFSVSMILTLVIVTLVPIFVYGRKSPNS